MIYTLGRRDTDDVNQRGNDQMKETMSKWSNDNKYNIWLKYCLTQFIISEQSKHIINTTLNNIVQRGGSVKEKNEK